LDITVVTEGSGWNFNECISIGDHFGFLSSLNSFGFCFGFGFDHFGFVVVSSVVSSVVFLVFLVSFLDDFGFGLDHLSLGLGFVVVSSVVFLVFLVSFLDDFGFGFDHLSLGLVVVSSVVFLVFLVSLLDDFGLSLDHFSLGFVVVSSVVFDDFGFGLDFSDLDGLIMMLSEVETSSDWIAYIAGLRVFIVAIGVDNTESSDLAISGLWVASANLSCSEVASSLLVDALSGLNVTEVDGASVVVVAILFPVDTFSLLARSFGTFVLCKTESLVDASNSVDVVIQSAIVAIVASNDRDFASSSLRIAFRVQFSSVSLTFDWLGDATD